MPRQIGVVITEVPLIDLEPDEQPSPARATPPPPVSAPTPLPSPAPTRQDHVVPQVPPAHRTSPRYSYTSDDDEDEYEPTTPPTRTRPVPSHSPGVNRTQTRIRERTPPRWRWGPGEFPQTIYELGESSRQAERRAHQEYRAPPQYHDPPRPAPTYPYPPQPRPSQFTPAPPPEPPFYLEVRGRLQALQTGVHDTQTGLRELTGRSQDTQSRLGQLVDRVGELDLSFITLRDLLEGRTRTSADTILRHYTEFMGRLAGLQSLVYGVAAMAALAALIAALPYFLP